MATKAPCTLALINVKATSIGVCIGYVCQQTVSILHRARTRVLSRVEFAQCSYVSKR